MRQWIARALLHVAGFVFDLCALVYPEGHVTADVTPCKTLAQDNVRLFVQQYPLPCGHIGYGVRVECYVDLAGRWIEIADLRDYNLHATLSLLTDATRFIDAQHAQQRAPALVED